MWIDLGIKMASNEPAAAYSVVPNVIRLYYLANGDFDHVTFEGISMSLLVPGVLFLRGRLNLGDTSPKRRSRAGSSPRRASR